MTWNRRSLSAGAAVVATVVALSTVATAATTPAPDGAKTLKESLAYAAKQNSVHTKTLWKLSSRAYTIVADAGVGVGVQQATLNIAKQSGSVTTELVKKMVYFRGSQFGLVNFYNFPAKAAKTYANKWISVSPSDANYSSYASGLVLNDVVGSLWMSGPFTVTKTVKVVDGSKCWGVTGNLAHAGSPVAQAVLYIKSDKNQPLPVEQVSLPSSPSQGSLVTDLSNWGSRIAIAAPSSAVPISVVIGGGSVMPKAPRLFGTLRPAG